MNWKVKNAIFCISNMLPNYEWLYYLFQKNITKSVWRSEEELKKAFARKVGDHIPIIRKYGLVSMEDAIFFEFGAGWDMLAPLGFALIGGVKRYFAVDLNRYIRPELVIEMIGFYGKYVDEFMLETGAKRHFNIDEVKGKVSMEASGNNLLQVLQNIGIEYYAPMDAGNTSFKPDTIDYVISNVSLEHIPKEDIDRIFRECFRILKSGGVISVTVDYTDHWSHTDHSICVYNYLKYGEKEWKKYNPPNHYQNRLRNFDYLELLKSNGFEILECIRGENEPSDIEDFKKIKISDIFNKYSIEELLTRREHFIARKK